MHTPAKCPECRQRLDPLLVNYRYCNYCGARLYPDDSVFSDMRFIDCEVEDEDSSAGRRDTPDAGE